MNCGIWLIYLVIAFRHDPVCKMSEGSFLLARDQDQGIDTCMQQIQVSDTVYHVTNMKWDQQGKNLR